MFDPAVMGTLIIGLNAAEAESRYDDERRPRRAAQRREGAGVRVAVARTLRRIAAAVEPQRVGEVANELG
jgi:hypothetical protein